MEPGWSWRVNHTNEETMVSDLTYDLRSGAPDFVDKLIASTSAPWRWTPCSKKSGLIAALVNACYAVVPISDPKLSARVDVATMYNTERYRPDQA